MAELILIILSFIHILLSAWGTFFIQKNSLLDSQKKTLNTILLWLIPFIWFFVVKNVLKQISDSDKKKESRTHFHESGKGIY
ncbi:MAG TPA: hypothetical protein VJI69_03465 [Bacteroidia bacterium]|nr:hypothetical protein [Bacteroidia bacterium]